MPYNKLHSGEKKKVNNSLSTTTITILLLIGALAAILTYYPHFTYQFPLHVDEWYHIAAAQKIALTHSIPSLDVYMGRFASVDPEVGYHVTLAAIIYLFNPSIIQWIYLPSILEVIAVMSVFLFVYRLLGRNEALISALLVALLPSSVSIGGPVFLIPENLGLIFIPLGLMFGFGLTKIKPKYNYLALFLISTFLLYAHPPTALILIVILLIYSIALFLSRVPNESRRALYLIAVLLISGIASLLNYIPYLQAKGLGAVTFNFFILENSVLLVYGILQTIFFLAGFYLLTKRKSREIWSLLIGVIALFVIIFLFANFNFNYGIPYSRVYIPLFLLMSIIASCGYASLINLNKKFGSLGYILLVVALLVTSYISIHIDFTTPYYHLISNQDYSNFLLIKSHSSSNAIVIMNPYTAKTFTPITGMHVYVVEPFGPSAAYATLLANESAFFAGNCTDTELLIRSNISIVYTNETCLNSNLTKIYNNTYILNLSK